jgi:5-methylcytosine-specific restriction endonuclease McrA
MAATVLLLNASFEPLGVISPRRAVTLVLGGKAEPVEEGEEPFRSEKMVFRIPAVLRLLKYVKVPFRRSLAVTRKAVLARDGGKCAYCSKTASTIDHIHPRSKGGKHIWTNVVASCQPCNSKKDDKLLSDLGWKLRIKPTEPKATLYLLMRAGSAAPVWESYLTAI